MLTAPGAVPKWRTVTKICKHCGKPFKPEKPCQVYCTGECRRLHYTVVHALKKCAFCGRSFLPRQAAQKYCCQKCSSDADTRNRQKKSPWRTEERICVICGANFIPTIYHQKTCCHKCRDELNTINSSHKTVQPSASAINRGTGLKYSRKCHDCGKPTNDYRCEKCRQRWRNKNKIQGDSEMVYYSLGLPSR